MDTPKIEELGNGFSHITIEPDVENSPICFDLVEGEDGDLYLTITNKLTDQNGAFAKLDDQVSLETACRMFMAIMGSAPTGMSPQAMAILFPTQEDSE